MTTLGTPFGPAGRPASSLPALRESFVWSDPTDGELRAFPVPVTWGPGARAGAARIANNSRGTLAVAYSAGRRNVDSGSADTIVGPYQTVTIPIDSDGLAITWLGPEGNAGDQPQTISVELTVAGAAPTSSAISPPARSGLDSADHLWQPPAGVIGASTAITWALDPFTIMSARIQNRTAHWLDVRRGQTGSDGWIASLPPFSQTTLAVGARYLWLGIENYHQGGSEAFVRVQLFDVEQDDDGPHPLPILTEPGGDLLQKSTVGAIPFPGAGVFQPIFQVTQGRTFVVHKITLALNTSGAPVGAGLGDAVIRTQRSFDGLSAVPVDLLSAITYGGTTERGVSTFRGPLMVSSQDFPTPINVIEIGSYSPAYVASYRAEWNLYGWYLPDAF